MFERYTEPARKAVFFARYAASQYGTAEIETEHLLLGILRVDTELAQRLLLSPQKIEGIREQISKHHPVREKVSTSVDMPVSAACKRALEYAAEEAARMKHKHIRPDHLLLGLSREKSGLVPNILREYSITTSQLRTDAILSTSPLKATEPEPPPQGSESGRDLTQAARAGKLGPLIGRERELERLIHILSRRTKNNCVLIGEAGVGKTAIVDGMALRLAQAHVPPPLAERRVIALDASSLIASGPRTHSAQQLDDILADLADSATILFVRGLFNLAIAGSAWPVVEAMHVLEPHLASGRLQCIATGSSAGLRETAERAATLARHFEIVDVEQVNEEEAIRIVSSLIAQFERFHEVTFAAGVIEKAVYASGRVLPGRHLPDRALDLLDEAAVAVRLRRGNEPPEMAAVRKKIRQLMQALENAIASHQFEKARGYSDAERKEREYLEQLRAQLNPNPPSKSIVTADDIEIAAAARASVPLAAVQGLLQQKQVGDLRRIIDALSAALPVDAREWVPFLAAYLVRCSAAEAEKLAQVIAAAKPPG